MMDNQQHGETSVAGLPAAKIVLPTIHDWPAIEDFRRRRRLDPDRIRRMQYALYHDHESLASATRRLGPTAQAQLWAEFAIEPLQSVSTHASQLDQSTKLVLRAGDGQQIETVILRAPSGRAAVCVSTQVGCQAGCAFCATARMGWRRNLTAAEMLEQVLIAARATAQDGRRLRNVVFMGMGEPLDNEVELQLALERLQDDRGFRIPPRRLSISTVGVPDAMVRLVDRFPGIQLALSLHSARPELRSRLIPWARRYSLAALRSALIEITSRPATHRHQGRLMIEYILIAGVNDGDEDALALVDYLQGLPVHVNLIPYNPVPHVQGWQPTARARRDEFAAPLRRAGLFTTIRYSLGADVAAACGQLAQPASHDSAQPRASRLAQDLQEQISQQPTGGHGDRHGDR